MSHRLLDAAHELLTELVAYDTVSVRSNVACAQLLADRLERAGFQVDLFYDRSMGQAKASLLARTGPAEDGGLILSGHMDVVPWADQPGWSRDALRLGRVGDRLVGRGVADMKGFLAQCVAVAEDLDHRRLRRPLALLFTCDEEVGCLGAQRLLPQLERLRREQPLPADCLIGEPSDFRVYRAHKGHVRFTLTTRGRGGHSSRPDLGTSAITAAAAAALEVERMSREMNHRVTDEQRELFPEYPAVPFNLGTISGGTADNMIAERCELVVAFRQTPDADVSELLEELHRRLHVAVARTVPGAEVDFGDPVVTPAMRSPADAEACRDLCIVAGEPQACGAPYATDGGQLERVGIRSWICGPGELAQAHQPDESLPVAALDRGLELVETMIERRCTESVA